MLILSRKPGERIRIADDIVIVVKAIKGNRVSIGVEAPKSVCVLRGEVPVTAGKLSPSC
jgi:carbon storage regulator